MITLNPDTGALDPYMNLQISGHHNDSGSGAQGAVRVDELVLTPDGTSLFAIGNFKRVDGIVRDQIVRISLTGATPVVDPNWATNGFTPYCSSWAFDSWVRGISMSPDGTYFVVATTGGPNEGTLCDTASRWETASSGLSVQPTWVNSTGGDTLWAAEVTPDVVFVGGHQRWNNNPLGRDSAKAGAVPSPGLMALDPASGTPMSWNPGRNPRGAAVYDLLGTADGLWLGSDTDWIGNFEYRRKKVAFFPREGGEDALSRSTGELPGEVYIGGKSGDSFMRTTFNGTTTTALQAPASPGRPGAARAARSRSATACSTASATPGSTTASSTPRRSDRPRWSTRTTTRTGSASRPVPARRSTPASSRRSTPQPGRVRDRHVLRGRQALLHAQRTRASMYWRWFNPDSGAMGAGEHRARQHQLELANGMFLNGTNLYVGNSQTGQLRSTTSSAACRRARARS